MAVSEIASEQPDPREGASQDLTRWEKLAVQARMALRLLPMIRIEGDPERTRELLLAAEKCAVAAGLTARRAQKADASALRTALDTVDRAIRAADDEPSAWALIRIRATAALALGRRVQTVPPQTVRSNVWLQPAQFSEQNDEQFLQEQPRGKETRVPEAFWDLPLWHGSFNLSRFWLEWDLALRSALRLEALANRFRLLLEAPAEFWRQAEEREFGPAAKTAHKKPVEQPPPTPHRVRLQLLADASLQNDAADLLDFKAYSRALAGLIDNPETGTPLTLAINGPWGAGKSTLARMVERRLRSKPAAGGTQPHATCWFNAWMHDDATDLSAAFAAEVSRAADRLRPRWRRWLTPLPIEMRAPNERWKRRGVAFAAILLLAVILTVLTANDVIREESVLGFIDKVRSLADGKPETPPLAETDSSKQNVQMGLFYWLLLSFFSLLPKLSPAARAVSDWVRNPQAAATAGTMSRVRDQLGKLIHQATPRGSRFIVFVDDLERCRPPRAVDVLEVVNQLLCHENVVVVVMADMEAVAACAEIKYDKLAAIYSPGDGGAVDPKKRTYGRLYLQKIIQMQFDLPPLRPERLRALVTSLAGLDPSPAPPPTAAAPAPVRFFDRAVAWRASLETRWFAPEREDLREAARRRPVPRAVVEVARTAFLLPATWITRRATHLAYRRSPRLVEAPPNRWVRLLRALRIAASWCFGLSITSLVPLLSWYVPEGRLPSWLPPSPWLLLFALIAGSLAAVGLLAWIEARLQRGLDEGATFRVRKKAREGIDSGVRDEVQLSQALEGLGLTGGFQVLLDEALQLHLVNESELLRQAEAEAIPHLPPLPRNAKRALNHLRLLLFLAHEKKVLGGNPAIDARHIGRWIVLNECWPELARALADEPAAMAELEKAAADPAAFAEKIRCLAPAWEQDRDLLRFCGGETRLGDVLERLVHLDPASPPLPAAGNTA